MATVPKTPEASLPPDAAFVLQLRSDTDVERGTIAGRVEHVASGRATRFSTIDELLSFIGRTLGSGRR